MKLKTKILIISLSTFFVIACVIGIVIWRVNADCRHQWNDWEVTSPTCTEAGLEERKCSKCDATEKSVLDALGHNWNEATCLIPKMCDRCYTTEGTVVAHVHNQEVVLAEAIKEVATCTSAAVYYKSCVCGAISSSDTETFTSGLAITHSYVEVASTNATCEAAASKTYRCSCEDEYTENIGDALGHSINGVIPVEKLVANCEYVLVYVCKETTCQKEVEGEHLFHHTYVARITTPATCLTNGEKTLTCSTCSDIVKEIITKDETGHNWVLGTVANNLRVDTCSLCQETKNVIVYSGNATDSTSSDTLLNTEIEVNNVKMILDQGVINIIAGKNVVISVLKIEGEDRIKLGISNEKLAQIGDNPIYDFTLNDGSVDISEFGESNWVMITIPYTLAEGESVDNIAVWFINDSGQLESINATYNNGFVTFRTNHFSYYTITQLTPAERCALYGHNYKVYQEEGSCTQDSYDLHVCVCCHESHREKIVMATGHDYTMNKQEATCTEDGSILYTCSECHHSYNEKLNATGHSWNIEESQDATCSENGYIKYGCVDCDAEYTEKTGKTSHNYKTPSWKWASDHTSAVLTLVCENNDEHVLVLIAEIEKVSVEGSCSSFVKTTYTASVSYNDTFYIEEWVVETGSPNHSFSDEWKFDNNEHYHECICGEKSDVSLHNFVNGHCEICGLDCDHTELHQEFINFSDYGACLGYFYYDVCKCGEVKILDSDHSTTLCDLETTEETSIDEDGNTVIIYKEECTICEIKINSECTIKKEACKETEFISVSIIKNDEVILENACFENIWTVQYLVQDVINITTTGACGGSINVYKCIDCNEITSIFGFNLHCNIDLVNKPEMEEVVDQKGVIRYVYKLECPDCDLVISGEEWEEVISVCKSIFHKSIKIAYGTTSIIELDDENVENKHEYETSYEMLGEACDDGVKSTKHCSICQNTIYEYYSDHKTKYYEVIFNQYGGCAGSSSGICCEICKIIIDVYNNRIGCNSSNEPTPEEVIDENGIKHAIVTVECPDCVLKFVNDIWSVKESVCVTVNYQALKIYASDVLIFDYIFQEVENTHEYEYSYEMLGETCEDGYNIISHCDICEETKTEYEDDHNDSEWRYINLGNLGLCDGYIEEEYCLVCNYTLSFYNEEECDWELVEINEEGFSVYSCNICGFTKWEKIIDSEKDDECKYIHTKIYIYMLNGTEVQRYEMSRIRTTHHYKYDFIMNGTSCTDGYVVITTCHDCELNYKGDYTRHRDYIFFDDQHYECCDEHHLEVEGCSCGYNYDIAFDDSTFRYDQNLHMYVCDTCSLSITFVENKDENGCILTETTKVIIKLGDEELYSYDATISYSNHYFNNVSMSESDGIITLKTICDKCQKENSMDIMQATMEYHNGQYYYDYVFVPEVTSTYTIKSFSDDDTYVTLYNMVFGELEEVNHNDDGGPSAQFHLSANLTAGKTYVFRISFYRLIDEGTINFALGQSDSKNNVCTHYSTAAEYTMLLEGSKTCEDGMLYGNVYNECGCFENVKIENDHYIITQEKIYLTEYGACSGEFIYRSCACGEEHNIYLEASNGSWSSNKQYDANNNLVEIDTYTCSDCEFVYTCSYYSVRELEKCTTTHYYNVTINVGTSLSLEKEYIIVSTTHEYQITRTLEKGNGSSCEDGVLITSSCKYCDHEKSYNVNTHEKMVCETIDLSNYGSVCGGYAQILKCTCNKIIEISFEHSLCHWSSSSCLLWIEEAIQDRYYETISGIEHIYSSAYIDYCTITDSEESTCSCKIRRAKYWLKEDNECIAYQYETYQFGYDEEKGTFIYEVTYKTGESKTYHNYLDSSTENSVKYDCVDCKSYYYNNSYFNSDGNKIKSEIYISNTLNDGNDKYKEIIEELSFDQNGNTYQSRAYNKLINSKNEVYWSESFENHEAYTTTFGEKGYAISRSYMNSNGATASYQSAYVYYKETLYLIYKYEEEGNRWYKYDYTYTFTNGCVKKEVFTNSDGENITEESDNCKFKTITVQEATCSQEGISYKECKICEKKTEKEVVNPLDHDLVEITTNCYYCINCDFIKDTKESDNIIIEDFTDTHGNNENYVVGYYARNNVQFSTYVSLILSDKTEVVLEGITFTTIENLQAFVFSKTVIETIAKEKNYTDYDVRFTFVTTGLDGSSKYSITLTKPTQAEEINDQTFVKDYLGTGETINYTIKPTVDGTWTFTTYTNDDTYGSLYDGNGNLLVNDDDSGKNWNFNITYLLEAGKTYTLTIQWHASASNPDGYVPLIIAVSPATTA